MRSAFVRFFLQSTPAGTGASLAIMAALFLAGCASQSTPVTAPATPATPATPAAPAAPAAPAIPAAAAEPATPLPPHAELVPLETGDWKTLFNGSNLDGWKVTEFAGRGEVRVEQGKLMVEMGAMLSGVNGVNPPPKTDYELSLDAMRVTGSDFFCGVTFPVGDSCCSLIVGGWGGGCVGISSINNNDASMNETTKWLSFDPQRWYRIRVRVTQAKLEAWIGKQKVADVELEGKRITVRPGEIESSQPFGLATYQTTGAYRNIQWRPL